MFRIGFQRPRIPGSSSITWREPLSRDAPEAPGDGLDHADWLGQRVARQRGGKFTASFIEQTVVTIAVATIAIETVELQADWCWIGVQFDTEGVDCT